MQQLLPFIGPAHREGAGSAPRWVAAPQQTGLAHRWHRERRRGSPGRTPGWQSTWYRWRCPQLSSVAPWPGPPGSAPRSTGSWAGRCQHPSHAVCPPCASLQTSGNTVWGGVIRSPIPHPAWGSPHSSGSSRRVGSRAACRAWQRECHRLCTVTGLHRCFWRAWPALCPAQRPNMQWSTASVCWTAPPASPVQLQDSRAEVCNEPWLSLQLAGLHPWAPQPRHWGSHSSAVTITALCNGSLPRKHKGRQAVLVVHDITMLHQRHTGTECHCTQSVSMLAAHISGFNIHSKCHSWKELCCNRNVLSLHCCPPLLSEWATLSSTDNMVITLLQLSCHMAGCVQQKSQSCYCRNTA